VADSYACINSTCGKPFPRAVNFCPYCGTRQPGAVHAPQPQPRVETAAAPSAEEAAAAYRAAVNANEEAVAMRAAAPAPAPPPAAGPKPVRAGDERAARPPPRKPVSKSTWLLVGLLVLAIWLVIKPDNRARQFEGRVSDAIALTADCRISSARSELSALRSAKATPEQLKRLQDAIDASAPDCEKVRQRARAWADLQPGINSAMKANKPELAASRLAGFTKKWGEDKETDAVFARIDTMRAEMLLDDANACLKQGNHQCAEAKLRQVEKLNRPEVAARLNALKDALSRFLESTVLQ
jgi:hypothetical protein